LLLRTIEVEAAPKAYVDELRQIAKRSGSHLLPPPRFVLVGAALGELPVLHFSPREEAKKAAPPAIAAAPPAPKPPAPVAERAITTEDGYEFPPLQPPAPAAPVGQTQTSAAPIAAPTVPAAPTPEAPAVQPSDQGLPTPFRAGREPRPRVGWAPPAEAPQEETPFGAPFAVPPPEAFGAPPAGIPPSSTWQWEPPEGEDDGADTPFGPKP
jgi:hypothetical protein